MKIRTILSKKYPGAVFLKIEKTDDFVLKIYPNHADKKDVIIKALENFYGESSNSSGSKA